MNAAFRRTDAVETLDSFAAIIVLHMSMLVCFPKNREVHHWKKELEAFKKTLIRYNKGKKGRLNFTEDLVISALEDVICDDDGKERIYTTMDAKGLSIDMDSIDWISISEYIKKFSKKLFS